MPLRLAGEEFSVVQGLDALGWPRLIQASDASPGLKVVQSGSGPVLEYYDGASKVLYMDDGGDLVVSGRALDVRNRIKNTGSADSGAVTVDDTMRVAPLLYVEGTIGQGSSVILSGPKRTVEWWERTTHLADADVGEDFGMAYIYNSVGTRQLVVKMKDAGVVYTGTLNLT